MISQEILGLISIAIAAFSYGVYIVSILKGRTKPHVFSWFIWGILAAIAFFAQMSDKGGPGAWVTGFSIFVCFIISALAFFKGEKHITKTDWICLIAALITIPLWHFTKTPLYSVILIVIIDIFGFIPTLTKSLLKPYEESVLSYTLGGLKHIISALALINFSFITAIYPLSLLLLNWGLVSVLLWRRSVLKKRG